MLLEGEMKLDSKEETQVDTGGTYQTPQSNKTQVYDQTGNIGAVRYQCYPLCHHAIHDPKLFPQKLIYFQLSFNFL